MLGSILPLLQSIKNYMKIKMLVQ